LPLRGFDDLEGLRIAQISDIHVGQNLGFAQSRPTSSASPEISPTMQPRTWRRTSRCWRNCGHGMR
jgi:hypothetical protein